MWFTLLIVACVVALLLVLDTRKPRGFPPGPAWLPLVGSAREVYRLRERTGYLYRAVRELARRHCRDGPALGLRIGKDRIVMVNSLAANREMLLNEDLDGRPKGIFYQTRTWGERRGVLLTDGALWREQRRFLLKHLRDFGFGRKGMAEIAAAEAAHMVHDVTQLVAAAGGERVTLSMHNFFNTYILNTLWTMMAGIRYSAQDPQMRTLQALLYDLFAAVDMVGTVFSHFPLLSVLAPALSGYEDFVRTHERIWRFLRDELARHQASWSPEREDRDFMDAYLRALSEGEGARGEGPRGEASSYSEGQLVAMCMDMFMAGTETTSKSMSFGFSYLVREPAVQERAQQEIDHVVGRARLPTADDRPNMPYNEAVVHECVRHFMGRTFGVPHRALRDTSLAGCRIPKDTMVVSNFTAILTDPTLFPEPLAFRPERFLRDGKVALPEAYFPFGLARHRCMGDVLAKCNMFVFTTTLLQRFRLLPAAELPSLRHVDGATPSAAPFQAVLVPRE